MLFLPEHVSPRDRGGRELAPARHGRGPGRPIYGEPPWGVGGPGFVVVVVVVLVVRVVGTVTVVVPGGFVVEVVVGTVVVEVRDVEVVDGTTVVVDPVPTGYPMSVGAVIVVPDRLPMASKAPMKAGFALMAEDMKRLKICAGSEPPCTPGRIPRTSFILC